MNPRQETEEKRTSWHSYPAGPNVLPTPRTTLAYTIPFVKRKMGRAQKGPRAGERRATGLFVEFEFPLGLARLCDVGGLFPGCGSGRQVTKTKASDRIMRRNGDMTTHHLPHFGPPLRKNRGVPTPGAPRYRLQK